MKSGLLHWTVSFCSQSKGNPNRACERSSRRRRSQNCEQSAPPCILSAMIQEDWARSVPLISTCAPPFYPFVPPPSPSLSVGSFQAMFLRAPFQCVPAPVHPSSHMIRFKDFNVSLTPEERVCLRCNAQKDVETSVNRKGVPKEGRILSTRDAFYK